MAFENMFFTKNNLVNRGYYLLQSCLNSFILPCGRFSPKHEILHFPPEVHTSARFAPLRRSAHRGICPLRKSAHCGICPWRNLPILKTKIGASLQLFCDCGLSSAIAKWKQATIQPIYLRFCISIRDWKPHNNPQSQKSCNPNRFFVSGLSD